MRPLLLKQVDLFADLEAKGHPWELHREGVHEQLRTLWLQMMNYRAQTAKAGDSAELSGRIRERCRSIERRVSAGAETERLLGD